jgi:hypothetical protein
MMKGTFNFRHVMLRVGIPSSNEVNWPIGQMLRALSIRRNVPVHRILAEKTRPDPSVSAPHVIAHYPMELFDEACEVIGDWWGDRGRQLDMFGEERTQ